MSREYELDDDYINRLKQQVDQEESDVVTTTADYEETKKKASVEELKKKKRKEMTTINKWKDALKKNDMDSMKDEIGQAIGKLYNIAMSAVEDVEENGIVVMKTTTDKTGNKIEEPIVNPAAQFAQKTFKDLDVTLSHFLLTPKSQKDSPAVQVNIGISADEVQARFMQRYSKDLPRNDDE